MPAHLETGNAAAPHNHGGNASIIFPSTIIRLYGAAAAAAHLGNQTTLVPARFEPSSGSTFEAAAMR